MLIGYCEIGFYNKNSFSLWLRIYHDAIRCIRYVESSRPILRRHILTILKTHEVSFDIKSDPTNAMTRIQITDSRTYLDSVALVSGQTVMFSYSWLAEKVAVGLWSRSPRMKVGTVLVQRGSSFRAEQATPYFSVTVRLLRQSGFK